MEEKIKKISDWIKDQGYPLEMYCENILSAKGFTVVQSLHYEDDETKKYREIDILATIYKTHNDATFNFSIVVECKLSKDKPWLLFARKPHKDRKEEILSNAFTTYNGKELMNRSVEFGKFSLLKFNNEMVGFNLTQCFTTGKDIPYQAIMGTINACEHLVKKSNNSMKKFCNFYFPVVVIDGELYKCYTNTDNDLSIESTEMEKLLTMRSYSERASILHTIVTRNGFKSFVDGLATELNEFIAKLESDIHYVSCTRPSNSQYVVM